MGLDLVLLAVGGALLYFGAEWLIAGAAGAALKLGVAPLLIGLTVVSYATSAPELAVSASAALKNQGALALGNVVGSNVANMGLILGCTILLSPPKSDGGMAGRELVILALATLAVPALLLDGVASRIEGVILLFGSVAFTWLTVLWSKRRNINPEEDLEGVPHNETRSLGLLVTIGVGGLVCLICGGEAFVRGAVGMAETLGIDERVIGLTVVAFGTSVPELAASIVAALRGHSDLAIGNVIGSNIFNLLLILGTTATIRPFASQFDQLTIDFSFLLGLTAVAIVLLWRPRKLARWQGGLLGASYLSFLAILVLQAR